MYGIVPLWVKHMLTITQRRILYLSFTVVFFVVAAMLLVYESGYRYDWKRRSFFRPALLALYVSPQPDRTLIDGTPMKRHGTTIQQTISPGVHTIELVKNGYYPWETTVTLDAGSVLNIGEIHLFRSTHPTTIAEDVLFATLSPNHKELAVLSTHEPMLSLVDTATDVSTPLVNTIIGHVDELLWNPDGTALLVRATANGIQTLSRIDLFRARLARPTNIVRDGHHRMEYTNEKHTLCGS